MFTQEGLRWEDVIFAPGDEDDKDPPQRTLPRTNVDTCDKDIIMEE
jgi:hypothetical protein